MTRAPLTVEGPLHSLRDDKRLIQFKEPEKQSAERLARAKVLRSRVCGLQGGEGNCMWLQQWQRVGCLGEGAEEGVGKKMKERRPDHEDPRRAQSGVCTFF